MIWWLTLTHPLALLYYWYSPRWWVRRDVQDFARDGAADSLHGKFHRQRLTWRVTLGCLVAALAAVPLLWCHAWLAAAWSGGGLAWLGGAYFLFDFNSRLSRARALPLDYVSPDPRAAFLPDRWLWQQAVRNVNDEAGSAAVVFVLRQRWAGRRLRRLRGWALGSGLLGYGLGCFWAVREVPPAQQQAAEQQEAEPLFPAAKRADALADADQFRQQLKS